MPKKRPIRYPKGVRPAPPDPQTGEARWTLRWRRDGHEHHVYFACETAEQAAEELKERIRTGNPYASKGRGGITVRRAVEQFLPGRETHATRIQDSGNLSRLVDAFGDRALRSITAPELREWLDGLRPHTRGPGAKSRDAGRYDPNTLMGFRRSCRVLWSWAIERGHAYHNPARDLVIPTGKRARGKGPAPEARKKWLEVDELRALFQWLAEPDNAHPAHSLLFRLQLRLGLRISEVCTLRADLLDWDAGVWTIDRAISQGEISPGKKGVRVQKYLSPQGRDEVRAWLAEHPPRDGYAITKPKRYIGDRWPFYDPRHVRRPFNAALAALGGFGLGEGVSTHCLRHSWSRIAEHFVGAVGPGELSQILGNTPAVAGTTYSSGPGPMARAIADHMEVVVFG